MLNKEDIITLINNRIKEINISIIQARANNQLYLETTRINRAIIEALTDLKEEINNMENK